jgi:hypothetical protein
MKQADEAFDAAFAAIKSDPVCGLEMWARENPSEFYKLYAGKRLTPPVQESHVVYEDAETFTEEQTRVMAEGVLESIRSKRSCENEPSGVHGTLPTRLQT